jgi:uncharacterized membrane protein
MEGCALAVVAVIAVIALIAALMASSFAKRVQAELRELRGMLARGEIRLPAAAPQQNYTPAPSPPPPVEVPVAPTAPLPTPEQFVPPASPPPISQMPPTIAAFQATAPLDARQPIADIRPHTVPPIDNRQPATDSQAAPANRQPPTANSLKGIDWESLVGIKLFGWIAGIALVLAAVFLFKYSIDHGWLRPAVRATMGLLTGVTLLIVCELRLARNYRFTANAMDGAGIAILYATLFALHGTWHLWPATAAFLGMLVVTAAAVFLSTRRD